MSELLDKQVNAQKENLKNVTGFDKTRLPRTRTEIQFIA